MNDKLIEAAQEMGATPMSVPDVPTGYREVSVGFYKFENYGDTIEGRLVAKNQITVKGNRIGKYTVMKPDGTRVAFLGSVRLDEQLALVGVGKDIYVQYTHEEEIEGGNKMKCFKVAYREGY